MSDETAVLMCNDNARNKDIVIHTTGMVAYCIFQNFIEAMIHCSTHCFSHMVLMAGM